MSTILRDLGFVLLAIAVLIVVVNRARRRPPRVVRGVIARQTAARSTHTPTAAAAVRSCRVCRCTDDHACAGGCWWVEADLCSSCREQAPTVDVEPVTVTKRYARDVFGRDGADESWAVALHNAPEGQLLPAGTPEVTIDDIDDRAIDDARWDQIWRDFDDRREAERYVSHQEWAERYPGPRGMREVFAEVDWAEIETHEAHLAAVATIMTGPIDLPAATPPPMPRMTPAQARRNRKRTNRGLVTA